MEPPRTVLEEVFPLHFDGFACGGDVVYATGAESNAVAISTGSRTGQAARQLLGVGVRFTKRKSGEWIQPRNRGFLFKCCDCGLIHRMDFRIATGTRNGKRIQRVQFRCYRGTPKTAGKRKVM